MDTDSDTSIRVHVIIQVGRAGGPTSTELTSGSPQMDLIENAGGGRRPAGPLSKAPSHTRPHNDTRPLATHKTEGNPSTGRQDRLLGT